MYIYIYSQMLLRCLLQRNLLDKFFFLLTSRPLLTFIKLERTPEIITVLWKNLQIPKSQNHSNMWWFHQNMATYGDMEATPSPRHSDDAAEELEGTQSGSGRSETESQRRPRDQDHPRQSKTIEVHQNRFSSNFVNFFESLRILGENWYEFLHELIHIVHDRYLI